jgi:hypothetical protein
MGHFEDLRQQMIDYQLAARGLCVRRSWHAS